MKKTVEFELQSDVITGGVRTASNFLVSEEHISGAVLRAGFAADILLDCPYADEPFEGKANLVAYRNGEKCAECPHAAVCREFGNMTFSYLYPAGAVPAPFTLRRCKAGCDSPAAVMDTIVKNGRLACPVCRESHRDGRMEAVKGLVNAQTGVQIKTARSLTTHTAIDINTGTALDGSLFSIDAIKRGQVYSGVIDDKDTGMIAEGAVVRVGKYSSNGFGKLRITSVKDYETPDIEAAVCAFEKKFGADRAALLFTSDAVLGLEEESGNCSSEEYLARWQRHIFGESSALRLEKIFARNFFYSGYDTSVKNAKPEGHRKAPRLLTERGTSVLVSFTDREAALKELRAIAENGIGADTETGCGSVRVCGALHLIGITEDE